MLLHFKLIAGENFIVINGHTGKVVKEMGVNDLRLTPCSTFKIALSLMGFDARSLESEDAPCWPFVEGYKHDLETWRMPQTPKTWMKTSCVWYSQVLTPKIGLEKIQEYLAKFDYGNRDMTGGLTDAWLSSSLKISPREQVFFLQKLVHEKLPLSTHAMQTTKNLLFVEEIEGDWQLFGKTGLGKHEKVAIGWFVGWAQKETESFIFAYHILDQKVEPAARIPRVKQLLAEIIVD